MKKSRRRIDVNLAELDRVLDDAREAPLSEADHGKLKDTLHAMAALLIRSRNTEKTSSVFDKSDGPEAGAGEQAAGKKSPPPGHGRKGAEAFAGARKVDIKHQKLIVSVGRDWKIALYFTGGQHAGENIADVLKQRSAELPNPIQMCDALSRNVPRLPAGVEILLANCLAHYLERGFICRALA